jgi:hypothetical protein
MVGPAATSAFFHVRPTSTGESHCHLTNDPKPNPASDNWDSRVRASAAAPHPAWKVSPRTRGTPRSSEGGWRCTRSWYAAAGLAGARTSCCSIRMDVAFPARFSRYSESCPRRRHADGCLCVAVASRVRAWMWMEMEMGRSVRARTWGWGWRQRRKGDSEQVQWRETCA